MKIDYTDVSEMLGMHQIKSYLISYLCWTIHNMNTLHFDIVTENALEPEPIKVYPPQLYANIVFQLTIQQTFMKT